jgi:hypothetical protein
MSRPQTNSSNEGRKEKEMEKEKEQEGRKKSGREGRKDYEEWCLLGCYAVWLL